jgi:hypothetical protein
VTVRAFQSGQITFPAPLAQLDEPQNFQSLISKLYQNEWVVYAKKPFGGPEKVLDYLARYTHRVAISNHRITEVGEGRVSFTYRDRADGGAQKECTLQVSEFIRRFLLHVLPSGLMRIRHFGFLANRAKATALARCRQLLEAPDPPEQSDPQGAREMLLRLTGIDIDLCPRCGQGTMSHIETLPAHPLPELPATSLRGPPC